MQQLTGKGFERGRVNNLVSPLKRLAGRNHDDHQLPFLFCLQIGKTRVQWENDLSKVTLKVNGTSCRRTQVSWLLVYRTIYSTWWTWIWAEKTQSRTKARNLGDAGFWMEEIQRWRVIGIKQKQKTRRLEKKGYGTIAL